MFIVKIYFHVNSEEKVRVRVRERNGESRKWVDEKRRIENAKKMRVKKAQKNGLQKREKKISLSSRHRINKR